MTLKAVALMLTLTLGLLATPVTTEGQKAGKVYRVGTLLPPAIHKTFRIEAFRGGLRDLGYVEGEDFVCDHLGLTPAHSGARRRCS